MNPVQPPSAPDEDADHLCQMGRFIPCYARHRFHPAVHPAQIHVIFKFRKLGTRDTPVRLVVAAQPDELFFSCVAGVPYTNSQTLNIARYGPAGLAWNLVNTNSWITLASGASGTTNGIVTYTAAANYGSARTGWLTVANQTLAVSQAASPCAYAIAPSEASVPLT